MPPADWSRVNFAWLDGLHEWAQDRDLVYATVLPWLTITWSAITSGDGWWTPVFVTFAGYDETLMDAMCSHCAAKMVMADPQDVGEVLGEVQG